MSGRKFNIDKIGETQDIAYMMPGGHKFNFVPTNNKAAENNKTPEETSLTRKSTQGKKGQKLPRISLYLTEDTHSWLSNEARIRGTDMATLLNTALDWYMKSPYYHKEPEEKAIKFERTWHANFGIQEEIYSWVKPESKYRNLPLSVFIELILREYINSPEGKQAPRW